MQILSLVNCMIWKYFLPFCGLSFCFVYDFLCHARAFKFKYVPLFIFFYCSRRWVKKDLSSKSFIVSSLTLELQSTLSFFLCMVIENIVISFFTCSSNFPRTTYWGDCLFSFVYSCLLCHTLIYNRCGGLFLGFQSCSIYLQFCFCARTILLTTVAL